MNNKHFMVVFVLLLFAYILWKPISLIFEVPPADLLALGSKEEPILTDAGVMSDFMNFAETFKTDIKNDIKSYFPLYENVLFSVPKVENSLNKTLYNSFGLSDFFPVNSKEKFYFKNMLGDTVIRLYPQDDRFCDEKLDTMIDFYNTLEKSHTSTNFNIYSISALSMTDALRNQGLNVDNGGRYETKMKRKLSKNIGFDAFSIETIEDYKKYFFTSDHHWNIFGAYRGYEDAISMLSKKNDRIGPARKNKEFFKVENVVFRGSHARLTADNSISDSIWDVKVDLPPYTVSVGEKNFGSDNLLGFSNKADYQRGAIAQGKYFNHYSEYFHTDFGEIIYSFGKKSNDNLLIFADSMSNCIEQMLASHYNKTYVVDLRHYEIQTGKRFNLEKYLEENEIDTVLFFTLASNTYFTFPIELGDWW